MAPEPGLLKRQRSRPSDWWAAKLSHVSPVPAQILETVVRDGDGRLGDKKKPGRLAGASNGGIKEVIGAGNRGGNGEGEGENVISKARKRKERPRAALETEKDATGKEKPLRRGRSSAGETDLRLPGKDSGEGATNGHEGKKERKRGRPAATMPENLSGDEGQLVPKRGRTAAAEEQGDELLSEQIEHAAAPKRSSRSSAAGVINAAEQEPEGFVVSKRKTRHSTGSAEDPDDELVAKVRDGESVLTKRARQSSSQTERPVGQRLQHAVSKKKGQPAASRVEDLGDGLVADVTREEGSQWKRARPPPGPTENHAKEQVPKKRGRPALPHTEQPRGSTSAPADQPQASKKRGRPPAVEIPAEVVPEVIEPGILRMRRSVAKVVEQEADSARIQNRPARGRTGQRKSDIVDQEQIQPKEPERGRRRTRQSNIQAADERNDELGRRRSKRSDVGSTKTAPEPVVSGGIKFTRSSRQSEVIEVETASSKLTKNRGEKRSKPFSNPAPANRGSPSSQILTKAKKATRLSNSTSSVPSQTHKKGSKRASQVEAPQRKRKGVESTQPAPSKRQRIEKVSEDGQDDDPAAELVAYQHLEPVTRNVSRRTITAKWDALPPAGIDRISQLLVDLQIPVVARLNHERKKTQASTALEGVSRKLITKLSRGIPFPPGTRNHREDDFDFEKILDHNRALEAQLTPTLHSNELLEAELTKEMARLESDMETLAELEKNAKTEASVRNKAARNLHSVLQPEASSKEIYLSNDNIGLSSTHQRVRPLDVGVQDDENIQALTKELDGHVDTIQGNIKQVQGIAQAIANGRAAVQATLFDHLDKSQYEDVVLGADADQGL